MGNVIAFRKIEPSEKSPEKKSSVVSLKEGKIDFPNGNVYTGQLLNGKMHGKGKLWFKTGGLISKHDLQERKANTDDYIEGEWVNGELYLGYLYDKNGVQKSILRFGRN